MIRKPLTTITINNDPTANALKPETQKLIKGFKQSNGPGAIPRKIKAGALRSAKKTIGSKSLRNLNKALSEKFPV